MAGPGGALLCRLSSSGALVRSRAPPSTAVPAGRGRTTPAPPQRAAGFRHPRGGEGSAVARGGDGAGSGAAGRGRCSSPGRRRGRCGPAGGSAGLRSPPPGLRSGAPAAGSAGRCGKPLLRGRLGRGARVSPARATLLGACRAGNGRGTRPLARAAPPRGSPPLLLSLSPPPSFLLLYFHPLSAFLCISISCFFLLLSNLLYFSLYFYLLSFYFSFSTFSLSFVVFYSFASLPPSLSPLPPPAPVLGATRELLGKQAFAPGLGRVCGSVTAHLAAFHTHAHTPPCSEFAGSSPPRLSRAINALERFILGWVPSCGESHLLEKRFESGTFSRLPAHQVDRV